MVPLSIVRRLWLAAGMALTALPVAAQPSLVATSPTTVRAGEWVSFNSQWDVGWTAVADVTWGPGDPEPAPGVETWFLGYLARDVSRRWGMFTFGVMGASAEVADAAAYDVGNQNPGSVHLAIDGRFRFDTPGSFEVQSVVELNSRSGAVLVALGAQRNCLGDAASGYTCSAWLTQEEDAGELFTHNAQTGLYNSGGPLTVTVLAVPEPASAALWLAGACLLLARPWRLRRHTPPRTPQAWAQGSNWRWK